jgi:hypothetical protein
MADVPDDSVHIFTDSLYPQQESRTGTLAELLEYTGSRIGRPVLDRTESSDETLSWSGHACPKLDTARVGTAAHNIQLARLLSNLAAQTGLSFEVETMPIEKWSIVEASSSR